MSVRIQIRRGTESEWTIANTTLALGEFGFDTTNEILKIGNGFDPWLVLEPFSTGAEAIALIKVIEGGEASTVDFDQIIDGGIHNTTYTETLDGGDSLHGRTDTGWWAATNVYYDSKNSTLIDTENIQEAVTQLDTAVTQLDTEVTQLDTEVTQLDTAVTQLDTVITKKVEHYNINIPNNQAGFVFDAGENLVTFAVTVQNVGGINVYFIDGVERPILTFLRGGVYTFDQSDSTNTNHPLRFRDLDDNTFTQGVVATGTPGTAGAKVVFTVPNDAPASLRYYCTVHGNAMGNTISITGDAPVWVIETTGAWTDTYIATIVVPGLLATDQPIVDLDLSASNSTTFADLQSDFALIFRVEVSADNTIKLYASDSLANTIAINIKVVR